MLRFADFYADRRQTTDKPIALPLAVHARTRGEYEVSILELAAPRLSFDRMSSFHTLLSMHQWDS